MDLKKISTFVFEGDRSAYPVWCRQMCSIFVQQGIDVTKKQLGPDDDTKLYHVLVISLQGDAARHAGRVPAGQGKALWDRLKKVYAPSSAQNLLALKAQLLSCTLDQCGGSPDGLIRQLEAKLDLMTAAGIEDKEADQLACAQLINQLPSTFAPVKFKAMQTKDYDFLAACDDVRQFAETYVDQAAAGSQSSEQRTLYAGRGRKDGGRQSGHFNGDCYYCGAYGHKKSVCKKRAQDEARQGRSGGGNGGGRRGDGGGASGRSSSSANMALESGEHKVMLFLGAFAASSGALSLPPGAMAFCVDSGASSHMCRDVSAFSSLAASDTAVWIANGQSVRASGIGVVPLSVKTNQQQRSMELELRDVIHMPDGVNLLSVPRLVDAGHTAFLGGPSPHLLFSSGHRLDLVKKDGLFWLIGHALAPTMEPMPSSAIALRASRPSPMERHATLGHMNERSMRDLGWLDASEQLPFCKACAVGKAKRQHVPQHAEPRVTKVGQLTHSDICGPMEVPSLSNKVYFMNFIDDATRYTTVYIIRSKSEVLACWKAYVLWLGTLGVKVGAGCVLQTDNDSVFKSQEFAAWSASQGVTMRFSAPYTQAQNGVSERNFNTLVDLARTYLAAAGLGKRYWALAVQHAACVLNMAPASALDGAIPFERLMGREPDYDRLRPFGCPAYVHVPRDLRKRWDAKARQGIYVGFSLHSKAYLIYYPDTNRVVSPTMWCSTKTTKPRLPALRTRG